MDLDELPPPKEEKKPNPVGEAIFLLICTFIMVSTRSIDFVLYVRMATKMRNYTYILADILLSLGFIFVAWPVVWFKMFVTKSITKEMRAFPNYKFILMGIFDSLSVLISTIPAALVPGSVNVAMGQSVILVNLIASYLFLHRRYSALHVSGVLLVVSGIVVNIWPMFAADNAGEGANQYTWIWVLLLFVSTLPMAASNVYKEKYLKSASLDVWYLNGWVAFYQFLFGLLCFPITLIPMPAPATYITVKELPQYFANGFKCFFGINSILTGNAPDQCDFFWLIFIIFMTFNITYNILILVIFQRGSSTLAVIASASRLALSNIGFLIPFLAGEATLNKFTLFDGIALIILILGIVFYSLTKESNAKDDDWMLRFQRAIGNALCCLCNRRKDSEEDVPLFAPSSQPVDNVNMVKKYYEQTTPSDTNRHDIY